MSKITRTNRPNQTGRRQHMPPRWMIRHLPRTNGDELGKPAGCSSRLGGKCRDVYGREYRINGNGSIVRMEVTQ